MSKKIKEQTPSFVIICFTTDTELYRPMTIIRQYLVCEECSNVKYLKEEGVEFENNLNKDIKLTRCKFSEILNIDKCNSKCNIADSYLIIVNLEKEEIFEQLDLIYNYIQNNGNTEKKIYIFGLYINIDNIKNEYKDDNIKDYLDQQKLNSQYFMINFDSTNDLVKAIDFISCDTKKNKIDSNELQNNDSNELDNGQSESKCYIF